MPRLLNSAVGLKGTTGTNTFFITLSEVQPNLGVTPTTGTGYTLVTAGPKNQLVWTSTLGDISFYEGLVYRNRENSDLTLTSTGSGRLNLNGNVFLNGQQLSVTTGTFEVLTATYFTATNFAATGTVSIYPLLNTGSINNTVIGNISPNEGYFTYLYANTASLANVTSTNIVTEVINATSATFDRLLADTATIFDSFVALGSVTLSPISQNISISPGGSGAVYINPSAMGLMDNMTIGLSVPRNGYFTNLTADTLTLNQPIIISTGSFVNIVTANLEVTNNANIRNLAVTGTTNLTNLSITGTTTASTIDAATINVDLLTATNIISTSATITDSLYAGSLYDNGNRVITQVTVTAGTGLSGGGTITGTSGTVTLTNEGVLTLVAGTDTAVSTSTGNVTIWNTSDLQSVTDRGPDTNNSIQITNNTASTSTNTGALTVAGGVGIGQDVHVEGNVYSDGGSPYYNRLLYTPKVTVNTTPPSDARIGDFWIDPNVGVEYQLVPNGTATIWVQFIGF